jgi:CBS domain-containing protein
MLVKDVMSTDVASVTPPTTVDQALHILVERKVTSLPVVDDQQRVVGILSEADLLMHLLSRDPRAHLIPVHQATAEPPRLVAEVMTRSPHVTRPEDDVSDLAAVMAQHGWKSVPVVRDGRLAGIVSRSDVLRALARPEAGLRREVQAVLTDFGHQDWTVSVEDGVVTVAGQMSARDVHAAEAAVLSVAGVRRVRLLQRPVDDE